MFLFYHFVMLVVKTVKATKRHTNVFGHLKQKRSKNIWFEHLNKYRVYTHKIVLALYNQHCWHYLIRVWFVHLCGKLHFIQLHLDRTNLQQFSQGSLNSEVKTRAIRGSSLSISWWWWGERPAFEQEQTSSRTTASKLWSVFLGPVTDDLQVFFKDFRFD